MQSSVQAGGCGLRPGVTAGGLLVRGKVAGRAAKPPALAAAAGAGLRGLLEVGLHDTVAEVMGSGFQTDARLCL